MRPKSVCPGPGETSSGKSLGIRSRRVGFGARSQWPWQLPRQSEGSPKTDSGTVRERRGPIPIDWVQGVAYLDPDHPPNDVPRHRWRQFVGDCKNFLSSSENWANRATRLGWDAMALFGCAPKRPLDYLGSAGLVWAINGGRLLELHRDWAVIDIPVHGSQRILPSLSMLCSQPRLGMAISLFLFRRDFVAFTGRDC